MSQIARQGAANAIFIYGGIAVGYLTQVLLMPRYLTPEQVGLTRLMLTVSSLLTMFVQLGYTNALIRFFEPARQGGYLNRLLKRGILIPLVGMALFLLPLWILRAPILDEYRDPESDIILSYYWLIVPLMISQVFFEVFSAYARASKKSTFPVFINEFLVRALVLGAVGAVIMGWISFTAYVFLFVGCYAIGALLTAAFLWIAKIWPTDSNPFPAKVAKETHVYGAWSYFNQAAGGMVDKLDGVMVSFMLSVAQTGIYGVVAYLTLATTIPWKGISQILVPQIQAASARGDRNLVDHYYKSSSSINFFIGGLLFILLWWNAEPLLRFINPEYLEARYVVLWLGLARLADMLVGGSGSVLAASKFYRYDLAFTASLLGLTVVSNIVLIPMLGLTGAAIATFISLTLYNSFKWAYIWRKLGFQPLGWRTCFLLFALTAASLAGWLLPSLTNVWAEIALRSGIMILVFMAVAAAGRAIPQQLISYALAWKAKYL